jgi:hypothetical protein
MESKAISHPIAKTIYYAKVKVPYRHCYPFHLLSIWSFLENISA